MDKTNPREVPRPGSTSVRDYLQAEDVHRSWIDLYRHVDNEPFYALAMDCVSQEMGLEKGDLVHDFGCGSGQHSIRLAQRGFNVRAFDFSESARRMAEAAIRDAGLSDRVRIEHGDVTDLHLGDQSVERGICWGVLMHVPEVEKAIAELARVMAPGGMLLVSERNTRSLLGSVERFLRVTTGKGVQPRREAAGHEYWSQTATGQLLTREADLRWLRNEFASHGMQLRKQRAGQFTELYTRTNQRAARRAIHAWNRFWFKAQLPAVFADANMLFFEKR